MVNTFATYYLMDITSGAEIAIEKEINKSLPTQYQCINDAQTNRYLTNKH